MPYIGPEYTIYQGYRYVLLPSLDHPLTTKGRRVAEHRVILWDKIGPGTHPCHWCAKSVTWLKDLQTDHVDWDKLNNSPENLVPSCWSCNFRRRNPDKPRRGDNDLSRLSRKEIRAVLEARKRGR